MKPPLVEFAELVTDYKSGNEKHCFKCACYAVCAARFKIGDACREVGITGDPYKEIAGELAKRCPYFIPDTDQPRHEYPQDTALGKWLSAALDDPAVCSEMKSDIKDWFNTFCNEDCQYE